MYYTPTSEKNAHRCEDFTLLLVSNSILLVMKIRVHLDRLLQNGIMSLK